MTGNNSALVLEHRGATTEGDQTLSAIQATGDLTLLARDPAALDRAADPASFIIQALERSKAWLGEVLAVGGIDEIIEMKSVGDAMRIYAQQKQLGQDAELAATEIVRRAERGLGIAVRRGQAEGNVTTRADTGRAAAKFQGDGSTSKVRAADIFSGNSHERAGAFVMADEANDSEFEGVIESAKAEGNLSRANVIAKVRDLPSHAERQSAKWLRIAELAAQGWTSPQIAREVGMKEEGVRAGARREGIAIPADKLSNRTRIKSTEVLEQLVLGLEVTESSLGLIRLEDISPEQATESLERLAAPLRALNRLRASLKEIA